MDRWGCSSTLGRAAALQAAGCRFEPCLLHQHRCSVNSVARVPACLAGSRGFDSRTGRQIAEIAQQVERRVESACAGGSNPSLGTRQHLVSSTGHRAPVYEAGGCTFESCTRYQQGPRGQQASNPSAPTTHAGLAQVAERRPPKPKVRGSIPWPGARQTSRRSQVVEGDGLQSRRHPARVRSNRTVESSASLAQLDRAAGF